MSLSLFPSPHLRSERDPVSETLCFLLFRTPEMDNVQKPSDYECYSLRSRLNLRIGTELQLERRECNNSVHLNPSWVANSVRPTK
jgi:hypothetical protein